MLLIVDFDCTFADTVAGIDKAKRISGEAAGWSEKEIEAWINSRFGTIPSQLKQLIPDNPALQAQMVTDYWQAVKDNVIAFAPLFPGAKEVVLELNRRGHKFAINTNKESSLVHPVLEDNGLTSYVQAVVGYTDVCAPKPNPAGILKILADLAVKPEDTCMLGDSTEDIVAALAAGVHALGVATGVSTREALLAAGAHVVYDNISQVLLMPLLSAPSVTIAAEPVSVQ